MNIKSFLKGTLQVVAFATFVCVATTSCVDDSATTNATEELNKTEFAGLVKTTLQVSLGGGATLDPATRSLDSDGADTRSVLIKHSGTKYTPIAEGGKMKARFFIVKETNKKTINGTNAIDPTGMVMGTAEIEFKAETLPNGTIHLSYDEGTVAFEWLNNSGVPRKGENWYMCGIIGGEYSKQIADSVKAATNSAEKKLYTQRYKFSVDFDPNSSPQHNKMDANGNVQVAAPYTTGWFKMTTKKNGVIDEHRLRFKPIGTLLHFRVKRDPSLVPAEACRYTFASSQLSANGAFLMMPQSMLRSDNNLQKDYSMGVDCEVRPETNSIEKNFYWSYEGDRQLHMNNMSSDINSEKTGWGEPLYEYRYTFDAQAMRGDNPKDGYDDFYVWGMPIPYDKYIGQTMLTAERGGYMLGRKQPNGTKYPYADEWLYASGTPALASGEFKVLDFGAADKKNKAYSVELGVCRPRFSDPKYPWANPLERLAVSNSVTDAVTDDAGNIIYAPKTFHVDNAKHVDEKRKDGKVAGWSLNSEDFKQRFVYKSDYLPDGYHVPSGEEWGIVLPNILTGLTEMSLPIGLKGWDNIKTAPKANYEMFDPYDDDNREMIVAGEPENFSIPDIREERYWSEKPAFYSYYMKDKSKLEMYAIRFNGNNPEAKDKKDRKLPGNRYCCAYRWRLMDAGGDAITNDGKGMRLIIQSRWIGNANVSVRDLVDDAWWGKVNHDNPLYNVDCYRILNSAGYPYVGSSWTWHLNYWSRTYWMYDRYAVGDPVKQNKTFCYRRISNAGFDRGHYDKTTDCYAVRLLCGRNQDEFGSNAPRQNQKDVFRDDLILRPADGSVKDWTYPKKKK